MRERAVDLPIRPATSSDRPSSTAPRRVQLRRTKGWRKPMGCIVVARPTKWGNPFSLERYLIDHPDLDPEQSRAMVVDDFRRLVTGPARDRADVVAYPSLEEIRSELRGHDLACWCPLVDAAGRPVPCHAAVLLELANR